MLIIDRFEDEYAVCEKENGEITNILKKLLPSEVKEGDVIQINGDTITLDLEETERRRKNIEKLTEDLWE